MVSIGFFNHRNTTATITDHQMIVGDQCLDGIPLDDAFRLWRRYDPAERVTICFENPAFFCL